ncbi:MAG: 4-hydroxy-tetrahydrodipicolinate synthase [Patescibacteria group bacterium]|nr:4-hydroxy-tetrahydrodipicolinate synthase [Patescibacteria group bacterium]
MNIKRSIEWLAGVGTALITPFRENGAVCYPAFKFLVEKQINGSVNFLVPCGTTGESPTLDHAEHQEVIARVIKEVDGRVPVLAGTGSNSTAEAVSLTIAAKKFGADGVLAVMPYYNKPTPDGIKDYYRQVAKVGLPVVLYDIPGRCGGAMVPAQIILELAREGTICGLKWASGNLDQLQDVLSDRPENFRLMSGDDNLTYPAMCLGANGVISVASNLVPREITGLVYESRLRDIGMQSKARRRHFKLLPLMRAMFLETNPIPVKTALAMMYPEQVKMVFRSPLVPMAPENQAKLRVVLEQYGLVEPLSKDSDLERRP